MTCSWLARVGRGGSFRSKEEVLQTVILMMGEVADSFQVEVDERMRAER